MDEYESFVKRRTNTPKEKEVEPIDSTEQQKIIDDFQTNYEKMVKSQRIQLIAISAIFSMIQLYIAFISPKKLNFVINSLPLLTILISQFAKINYTQYISIGLEVFGFVFELIAPSGISKTVVYLLHFATAVIIYFFHCAVDFEKQTPNQISDLAKKKYNYKIA